MSFLFGKPAPMPAPLPVSPMASDSAASARDAAERAALAERAGAGRRSTIVGGMQIAAEEQGSRGMLAKRKRTAASEMAGGA